MTRDVYLAGRRLRLKPTQLLGSGGEADVYDLGDGRALKLFKAPDHPDYQGLPQEQHAAAARLDLVQSKLRAFPSRLAGLVVTPGELATDRAGRQILGYAMPLVAQARPLACFADPQQRKQHGTAALVVELLQQLHQSVTALHQAQVVIGDCNDLNILVTGRSAHLIDADSFQYGGYPCLVFTERFLDPLLCDPRASAVRPVRPYTTDADWYAFGVLLMQSLLCVGPYGGVLRPALGGKRLTQAERLLQRVSVFHPDVLYPKPALPMRSLPDDVTEELRQRFVNDRRGPFPLPLLDALRFVRCPRCGLEHAQRLCPLCTPSAVALPPVPPQVVRGRVTCQRLLRVDGVVLTATLRANQLQFLALEGGALRREHGPVASVALGQRHLLCDATTVSARVGEAQLVEPGQAPRLLGVDADGCGQPAVASNGQHLYWCRAGELWRDAAAMEGLASGPVVLGQVLENQTFIAVGPRFGIGFYRAAGLAMAFLFDVERPGLRDGLELPRLQGQLVEMRGCVDSARAWLLLALQHRGQRRHLCLAYSATGQLEGMADALGDDGSWLGTLAGTAAAHGWLWAARDEGLMRLRVDKGSVRVDRTYPDTEPFVDAGCDVLMGDDAIVVVAAREIRSLRLQ